MFRVYVHGLAVSASEGCRLVDPPAPLTRVEREVGTGKKRGLRGSAVGVKEMGGMSHCGATSRAGVESSASRSSQLGISVLLTVWE